MFTTTKGHPHKFGLKSAIENCDRQAKSLLSYKMATSSHRSTTGIVKLTITEHI
jgi:hypothetical protein